MTHQVFISYAKEDETAARAVCRYLEKAGIRCWIALRDLHGGQGWAATIAKAVKKCRVLVVVFSAKANRSLWVGREVDRAIAGRKIIIPFRIEKVPASGALELYLAATQWLDAAEPPRKRHLDHLCATVEDYLSARLRSPLDDLIDDELPKVDATVKNMRGGPRSGKTTLSLDIAVSCIAALELARLEWRWVINLAYGYAAFLNLTHAARQMNEREYGKITGLVRRPAEELGIFDLDMPARKDCSTSRAAALATTIGARLRSVNAGYRLGFAFLWQMMFLVQSDDNPSQHPEVERRTLIATLQRSARKAGLLDGYSESLIDRLTHETFSKAAKKKMTGDIIEWAYAKKPSN